MILNTGARTDTAQYYSEWLLNRFKEGFVYTRNPLSQTKLLNMIYHPIKLIW